MSQLNMAVLLQITILFLSAIPSGTAAPLKEEVQANLITVTPTSANLTGTLTEVEDPEESDGDFKKSVHLSTALAGMVLLLFLQVHIRSHGYRLGRAFWTSSDNLMWVGMGVVSGLWTLLVFLSAWEWEHQGTTPCRTDPAGWKCAGRLAFVPWILDGVFWWWVLRYLWHRCRRNFKYRNGTPQYSKRMFARIREMEPFNNWAEPIAVYLLVLGPVAWTSIGALRSSLYTLGMLSLAAGIILFHTLQDYPFHLDLPHRCCMDDIRIALPTTVEYGIVYVLPSLWHGFEAVYSPKLDSEHADLEAQRHLLEPLDSVLDDGNAAESWTLGKCRNAVRRIIDGRIQVVEEDEAMLKDLARWLYYDRMEEQGGELPSTTEIGDFPPLIRKWRHPPLLDRECRRRADAQTLVGRHVVLALLLWETLVFRWRYGLYEREEETKARKIPLRERVWKLRDPRFSGFNYDIDGLETPGRNNGEPNLARIETKGKYDERKELGGLLEAVEEVYRLLGVLPNHGTESQHEQPEANPPHKLGRRKTWFLTHGDERSILSEKQLIEREMELYRQMIAKGKDETRDFLSLQTPPEKSVLFGDKVRIMDIVEYATKTWERCWDAYPCTFGALYLWTTIWYFDMGNNSGLCTTPLVPAGEFRGFQSYGPDYMSTWRMQWRHTWHTAVVCQLVIMLPTVISAFFSLMPVG